MIEIINWLHGADLLNSSIIIGAGILSSIIVDFILKVIEKLVKKTKNNLDDMMISVMRRPIFIGLTGGAIFIAALSTSFLEQYKILIGKTGFIFAILIITYSITRFIKGMFKWYANKETKKLKIPVDDKYLKIFRKVTNLSIYAIGLMIILNNLEIEISPFIASLGIGGLVVALALQESLSNFFSGFYMIAEKSLKIGNFIELERGLSGTIEDITWRVTKIRTLTNNTLLIPNSKLAQAVATNYDSPQKEMSVIVTCGVSYEMDLERVEDITLKIAKKNQKTIEGAVTDYEPLVRFKKFGDSNIDFSVILRAKTFVDQYRLKHEFIKSLKKEFDKQKIVINYPTQNLYFMNKLKK